MLFEYSIVYSRACYCWNEIECNQEVIIIILFELLFQFNKFCHYTYILIFSFLLNDLSITHAFSLCIIQVGRAAFLRVWTCECSQTKIDTFWFIVTFCLNWFESYITETFICRAIELIFTLRWIGGWAGKSVLTYILTFWLILTFFLNWFVPFIT